MKMTSADFNILLPEITLALFSMAALLFGVYTSRVGLARHLNRFTAVFLVLIALWICIREAGGGASYGMFVEDAFAQFAKFVILLSASAILLISERYMEKKNLLSFEFPLLVSLASVGMMVMVSAGDLIVLYLGLELQSLALYVIAAIRRDSAKSTEAGLKYFVLGALSSGFLLYGASLIYGYTGTTSFTEIALATTNDVSLGLLFGLVFMIAGLAFKVSSAPFHMWTPDVYEGAPTPVTAFFATAPKVAAIVLFARVVHDAFGGVVDDWSQIVAFLSVASMFLGALAAIGQRNIKRLMAYSSISHMGFALMGLASGTAFGVEAMLVYIAIYVTMNIGTFAFILSMERDGQSITDIAALQQYSRSEPLKALAVLVLMFSLAGIPPLVGFFGKFYVLQAAVNAGMSWLAVSGVIASVIGAFYYLRIVYFMYFGEDRGRLDGAMSPVQWVMLMSCSAIMVVGVVNLFGVDSLAVAAAISLVD